MKYFVLFMILFIALTAFAADSKTNEEKIEWVHSYSTALAKSHIENKPIMMDVYTSWCKWCKVLDQKTFPDKDVAFQANNFVCAKLNGEDKSNKEVVSRYQINSYPRIIFLDVVLSMVWM